MGDESRVAPGLARALEIAGVLVVAWGMLLLLTLGLTPTGIASTVFFFGYGVAIIDANRRAVWFGWNATAWMGVAAFLEGFEPALVLVWSWFFALAMFLTDSRDRLRAGGYELQPRP